MDDSQNPADTSSDDIVEALLELLRRFESGEIQQAVLQVAHKDGTRQDLALGFDTEEERDAAIAKLRRMLGQLH